MKKEKFMRSFKDYTPQSSPQDESEILKEAATAPDPAMESSAAELTKKIAAAFNGKSNSDTVSAAVEQRAAPPAQIRGGKTQKDLTPRGKKQRKGMKKRCPFFLVRRLFPSSKLALFLFVNNRRPGFYFFLLPRKSKPVKSAGAPNMK